MTAIDYPKPMVAAVNWWPCVYDCISVIAARRCGYDRVYLSAKSLSRSLYGTTDAGVLSADTYLRAISNIFLSSAPEIMVDAVWEGLPIEQTCYFAGRASRAGAEVFSLPAAVACTETGQEIIHRLTEEGRKVAITCRESESSGLPEMQTGMQKKISCCEISEEGAAIVNLTALREQGITDVILHFTENGTKRALTDFAVRTLKDRNTVYHDVHDYDGHLNGHDYHDIFDFGNRWLVMEQEFMDRAKMRGLQ